jgi:hypothetical protein
VLGTRGQEGERLLKRIIEGNVKAEIRGRACLALAFARTLQLRKETRNPENLNQIQSQPGRIRMLEIQETKTKTTVVAAEIEHCLRMVLNRFPGALREITDDLEFGFLAENLGSAADQILPRVAEAHPRSEIRMEADCGLAIEQMELAKLVADIRSVAALPPDSNEMRRSRTGGCVCLRWGDSPQLHRLEGIGG